MPGHLRHRHALGKAEQQRIDIGMALAELKGEKGNPIALERVPVRQIIPMLLSIACLICVGVFAGMVSAADRGTEAQAKVLVVNAIGL